MEVRLQSCRPQARPVPAEQHARLISWSTAKRPAHPARRREARVLAEPDRPHESEPEPAGSSVPDALPSLSSSEDWRDFRAKLIASGSPEASGGGAEREGEGAGMWAHPVSHVEQGMLLVAHPLMFTSSQEYFHQAVILIFQHEAGGSAGMILNRPTDYICGDLDDLCPWFEQCKVYLAGDVGENTYHLLHHHQLNKTLEVMRGVYLGGFEEAEAGVRDGVYSHNDFKVLTRYSGWGPGQLDNECRKGVWLMAAASRNFVLQQNVDGADMWHQALDLMGGDFKELSSACKSSYDASIMDYKPEETEDQ